MGKVIFWGLASIAVIGTVYYFLKADDKLAGIVENGLQKTRELGANLAADELELSKVSDSVSKLSHHVSVLAQEVKDLKNVVSAQSDTIHLLGRTASFLVKLGLRDSSKALTSLKTEKTLVDIKEFIQKISDSFI